MRWQIMIVIILCLHKFNIDINFFFILISFLLYTNHNILIYQLWGINLKIKDKIYCISKLIFFNLYNHYILKLNAHKKIIIIKQNKQTKTMTTTTATMAAYVTKFVRTMQDYHFNNFNNCLKKQVFSENIQKSRENSISTGYFTVCSCFVLCIILICFVLFFFGWES